MQKKERIRARCDDKLYKRLEKAAKIAGKNVSEFVRWVLENYLRRHQL